MPRGWYPEPGNDAYLRLWDGVAWTEERAPNPRLIAAPPPPPSTVLVPATAAAVRPARTDDRMLHPVYQRSFAQFDQGGSKATWSWPGFLFGPFWYFAKGACATALGIFAVAFFSAGFLAIPLWLYTAIMGRHDFYLVHRYNNQGWRQDARQ